MICTSIQQCNNCNLCCIHVAWLRCSGLIEMVEKKLNKKLVGAPQQGKNENGKADAK